MVTVLKTLYNVVTMKETSIVNLNRFVLPLMYLLVESVVETKKLSVRRNKFVSQMENLVDNRFVLGMDQFS